MHIQNPDRLFSSENPQPAPTDDEFNRSHINMPPKLPRWIWATLVTVLGIKTTSVNRLCMATFLHIVTLLSAFLFGACGLVFNIYDSLSEFSKTTVLVSIAKSVLGLYWIGLGIYANSLAARLFSNKRLVDCIRLHAKTFLKSDCSINLGLTDCSINMGTSDCFSTTYTYKILCYFPQLLLCQVYYGSKVFYSFFCLTWNLLVACIYLSVCRTHTISIRRFMKELMYDTNIFEEFCMIQALEEHQTQGNQSLKDEKKLKDDNEYDIWHDDIVNFDSDSHSDPPQNAHLLRTLRVMRQNTRSQLLNDISKLKLQQCSSTSQVVLRRRPVVLTRRPVVLTRRQFSPSEHEEGQMSPGKQDKTLISRAMQDDFPEPDSVFEDNLPHASTPAPGSSDAVPPAPIVPPQISKTSFNGVRPPIMKNEDLMFTYFQLLRRLCSTSRLLQRWISSWITFTLLWCGLLIVYWTTHTAQLSGIVQFLIPLVALGLLTSAYAEVNFEGERLLKSVLPTEERMSVLYYFQSTKLELKIFSFTMTYNTIVTVVAGIAVTFATRIILDQFSK
ncbi:unnamed protein product [Lymnaea stagnalis]|uniref:Uncharacterized protein n=1 Tax=Lymnaea stagnalis TaxID=6523 RepID=A0AAV2HA48_LYMST